MKADDPNDILRHEGEDGLRDAFDRGVTRSDDRRHDAAPEPVESDLVDRPPDFTDEALALRYAEKHSHDRRFVAAWGKWLIWTGTHWEHDETLRAFDDARAICREAAARCENPKVAAVIASARTVAAVDRLARSDRRLAATTEQWDADVWLLNTPGGTVDLRSQRMRRHDPHDYITKTTAVKPGGDCPIWLTFLKRITGEDAELQAFIQRMLGYALTGDTSAHALFFGYGRGANGKSVLIDTASGILKDYHATTPIEAFTVSTNDRHPTDLARLRGARLVTAVETEEGRRWAESRVKALTGGDRIAARFMRQDFFEFTPQFKLLIAGNHKPGLRSVDEAIRRRFHLVPFAVTIPAAERDLRLSEKLRTEWPGILKWMIAGCTSWQRDGLAPPPAVVDATQNYMEAEDATAAWIDERCSRDPQAWTSAGDLFASWKAWAEQAGEFVGSAKRFSQNLETRGFQPSRVRSGRGFQGLALLRLDGPPPHWSDR